MAQLMISQGTSEGLDLPWSWCARCHRAYVTGTCREIRFTSDSLHPHPATLKLCPYDDCSGSTTSDGWQWATLQLQHPDYPVIPKRDVIYARSA
jgi:hypothetical protein